MSRYLKNMRYVAEGADNAARLKNLLSKISGFLTQSIPHMIQTTSTDTSVVVKNTLYGYEITVAGTTTWDYIPSYSGVAIQLHVGNEAAALTGYRDSCNYDCDVSLASIDDLLFQLKITLYYYNSSNQVYASSTTISFGGFTGSYDGKPYYVSRVNNDIQLPSMRINGAEAIWRTPLYTRTEKYVLAPYYWYALSGENNFGLALFGENKDKVLYALAGPDGNWVTSDPNLEYEINGQSYLALSSHLIIPMANPFKAIQKPGEVLVWPE